MSEIVTQVGVGGALAIIILREVFTFVKNHSNEGKHRYVTRGEFDKHKEAVQYRDNCGEIVRRLDGNFEAMEKRDRERNKVVDSQFSDLKMMIGALRGNHH